MKKRLWTIKKKKAVDTEEVEIRSAQAERIAMLKGEVEALKAELEAGRAQERAVSDILAFAKARAEDYEKESRIRFALENERLAAYRDKWSKRLELLGSAADLGAEVLECQSFFSDCCDELTAIIEGKPIKTNPPREDFYREKERLKEIGVSDLPEAHLTESELNALLTQFTRK